MAMMRLRALVSCCSVLLSVTACGGGEGAQDVGPGVLSLGSLTAPTDGTTVGATVGDDTTATDGTKLDLAPTDLPVEDGCDAVDFLFVIDNSVSMQDQQNALKAAFPDFIDTIDGALPNTDHHIMVVDTDAEGRCSPETCTHETCQAENQYACTPQFVECDVTRGAGVVHPAGEGASNRQCVLEGNHRYIIEGQDDLPATFDCVASVGLAGNNSERPIDGMVAAVSPELLAENACNTGFLRDEAILVVTFLSDDPNVEDENTPQAAYDALVAAKGGNPDAIVMLGLIPAEQSHWLDFIARFGDRGIQGPIESLDYNQFFIDAVDIIADTCFEFQG